MRLARRHTRPRALRFLLACAAVACLAQAGGLAWAQDLYLAKSCEPGFRRFIEAAQAGDLGPDVTNANIGVNGNEARIELVRTQGTSKILHLTVRGPGPAYSRYFDVEPGEGAAADDAMLVGGILDRVFWMDPFEPLFDFYAITAQPVSALRAAWEARGLKGLWQALEYRFLAASGVAYTGMVVAVLAICLALSVLLLWFSRPDT